ncbi:MAG: glycosyltransferase [Saprospiraceae bacterium]|nr:glycosyltransferase [Saprospiraceae bacterium]MBP7680092.1 glycosyltransferase [Saprospiraceae bacterium]
MSEFQPSEFFSLIVFGNLVSHKEEETIVQAYADFYHDVTSKHQKRIKLLIVDVKEQHTRLNQVADMFELSKDMYLLFEPSKHSVSEFLSMASLHLLPSLETPRNILLESLKLGVPIIGYETLESQDIIDNTCGMLLKPKGREANVRAFTELIDMLYFDPEVLKILERGAKDRYQVITTGGVPSTTGF